MKTATRKLPIDTTYPAWKSFRKTDDPPELADRLERIRKTEWKFAACRNTRKCEVLAAERRSLLEGFRIARAAGEEE